MLQHAQSKVRRWALIATSANLMSVVVCLSVLVTRDAKAQSSFRDTVWLIALGSALVAILLGIAHTIASREAQRRQKQGLEVERVKREFISIVSHELRTPLTSIRGSLGLLAGGALGPLTEKATSMVKIAHQNSERLVRIINDILDMEKIESGRLDVELRNVPLLAFLHQALAANEGYGAKYQIRFTVEGPTDNAEVQADPDRLMQVLTNLLSNAAKFSPAGAEVLLRYRLRGARVRIEVEDHGSGIPEAFRGRVFEKFAQADSSSTRRFDGTGLGLSITRQLVHAMGGTIGFTTETGRGTTFYVDLPGVVSSAATLPAAGQSRDALLQVLETQPVLPRILHVEDDTDLSQVLELALGGRAELVRAATVQAATALLREQTFSLMILDPGLPDGNGLELLDQLDRLAAQPTAVLILSVSEMTPGVKQRVAAALVKSRASETEIARTALALAHASASFTALSSCSRAPLKRSNESESIAQSV